EPEERPDVAPGLSRPRDLGRREADPERTLDRDDEVDVPHRVPAVYVRRDGLISEDERRVLEDLAKDLLEALAGVAHCVVSRSMKWLSAASAGSIVRDHNVWSPSTPSWVNPSRA